ncbi:MAG: sensor histidine kinase [Candidatus Scalindua sp. AMX11]|nr:MAG: HAMP domain-containing protein [Candidatus Scalindua sp.]NOG82874.1 sensor histidine kinase [Planctomycetota bacterium]RZV86217.1 MAG: sensor histidine kinase [Candidatus Scalindua sp. SCAELEC01]TDE65838.1 MAG: sensor histidine kinase [Candidatus Scalindua sp. AMX11]GJQ58345.1 MAG: hypothetical protein SCALA701_11460 [Candidatus Scalindua sp.]
MKLTKIGKKLLCYFLLVSIVPIILGGTIVYKYLHNQTKNQVLRELASTAYNIKSQLNLVLQKKIFMVKGFGSDGFIRDCTEQLLIKSEKTPEFRKKLNNHLLINKLRLDPDIISISILGPDGHVIASTSQNLIGNDESRKEYFRLPYLSPESSGFFCTDVLPNSGTEGISDLIFSSILTDMIVQKPLGVIVTVVKGNILQRLIDSQSHGNSDEQKRDHFKYFSDVYILSSNSKIIAKTNTPNTISHKKTIDFGTIQRVSGSDKNYSEIYINHYGVKVLGTSLVVPETNWLIIAEKSLKDAFFPLKKLKYIFGAAGGGITFLIILCAIIISNHLNTDIRKLLIGINKVTSGNLTHSITIGNRDDEIKEVVDAFNLMVKQLRVSNESNTLLRNLDKFKDNIIKDVSHELKSPLSQLRLALELWLDRQVYKGIERRKANDKNDHFITIIQVNIGRLTKTIESVLTLADLEAGKENFDQEPFNIAELILHTTAGLTLIANKKGLSIKTALPDHLPEVLGDKLKITRVLSNLIDNSIKYTKAGAIIVSAKNRNYEIEISVQDTGVGIGLTQSFQNKIFDRFFQEKRVKSEGVGLGLSICNKIIEAHNGKIWVESRGKDMGSTFKFTLPKPTVKDFCECTGEST